MCSPRFDRCTPTTQELIHDNIKDSYSLRYVECNLVKNSKPLSKGNNETNYLIPSVLTMKVDDTYILSTQKMSTFYDEHASSVYGLILGFKIDPKRAELILINVFIAIFRLMYSEPMMTIKYIHLHKEALRHVEQELLVSG